MWHQQLLTCVHLLRADGNQHLLLSSFRVQSCTVSKCLWQSVYTKLGFSESQYVWDSRARACVHGSSSGVGTAMLCYFPGLGASSKVLKQISFCGEETITCVLFIREFILDISRWWIWTAGGRHEALNAQTHMESSSWYCTISTKGSVKHNTLFFWPRI